MKTCLIAISLLALAFVNQMAFSQTKSKLFSIGANEILVYGENCITLTGDKANVHLVTVLHGNKTEFFVYDNGIRKGPYNTLSDNMIKDCGNTSEKECDVLQPSEIYTEPENYIEYDDEGKAWIKHNGKKNGPYDQILGIDMSLNKAVIYAVVLISGEQYLVSVTGKSVKITGAVNKLIVSADGTQAFVKTTGSVANISDLGNIDMNNLEKLAADMNNCHIFSIDGKKYGPYLTEQLRDENLWFVKNSPAWYMIVSNKLYMNGNYLSDIDDYVNSCDIRFTNDGKKYVIVDYDKISFSDGSVFFYPLKVEIEHFGDKLQCKWISIENSVDIIHYLKVF